MKSKILLTTLLAFVLVTPVQAQSDWEKKKEKSFPPVPEDIQSLITEAVPAQAAAEAKKDRGILFCFGMRGLHPQLNPPRQFRCTSNGKEDRRLFQVDLADSYDVFTTANLAKYDAVLLNNTTHMKFPEASQLNAFLDFVAEEMV